MPLDCYPSWPDELDAHDLPTLRRCVQPVPALPGPMRLLPEVWASSDPLGGMTLPLEEKSFVLGTDTEVEVVIE
jgi:hypothetical protein